MTTFCRTLPELLQTDSPWPPRQVCAVFVVLGGLGGRVLPVSLSVLDGKVSV